MSCFVCSGLATVMNSRRSLDSMPNRSNMLFVAVPRQGMERTMGRPISSQSFCMMLAPRGWTTEIT